MIDLFSHVVDSLLKVEGVGSIEESRQGRVNSREEALMNLAMAEVIQPEEVDEEVVEVAALEEADNRSDSEAAFFFETLDEARAALSLALGLGLVEGEVIFDDSIDPKWGLGQFALRVEPIVVYSKPTIYQALCDGIAELAELSDTDLEMYGSPVEEEEEVEETPRRQSRKSTSRVGSGGSLSDLGSKLVEGSVGDFGSQSNAIKMIAGKLGIKLDEFGVTESPYSTGDDDPQTMASAMVGGPKAMLKFYGNKNAMSWTLLRGGRKLASGKAPYGGSIQKLVKPIKAAFAKLGIKEDLDLEEEQVPSMSTSKTDASMALSKVKSWLASRTKGDTEIYMALSKAKPQGKVLRVKKGDLDLMLTYDDFSRQVSWTVNGMKGKVSVGNVMKMSLPILAAIKKTTMSEGIELDAEELTEDVANTILKQMGGWNRIRVMIGAKHAAGYKAKGDSKFGEGMGGVSFRFPRPGRGKPNFVKIILNGKDLYDMTFGSIKGTSYKVTKEYKDVYNSSLKEIFEKETGLYLSL